MLAHQRHAPDRPPLPRARLARHARARRTLRPTKRGHASRVSTAPVATRPLAPPHPRRGAATTQPNLALPRRLASRSHAGSHRAPTPARIALPRAPTPSRIALLRRREDADYAPRTPPPIAVAPPSPRSGIKEGARARRPKAEHAGRTSPSHAGASRRTKIWRDGRRRPTRGHQEERKYGGTDVAVPRGGLNANEHATSRRVVLRGRSGYTRSALAAGARRAGVSWRRE
jgi:hypothetical protein